MSTSPTFFGTVNRGAVTTPATLDTSLTAPTNTATIITAGASGTKIEQIRINQIATTAASLIINIFIFDGATYHLFDFFSLSANALSTTSEAVPLDRYYTNLFLKSGDTLRCTVTTTAGQSAFKVLAFGGDA
jgi:hypothetical protein